MKTHQSGRHFQDPRCQELCCTLEAVLTLRSMRSGAAAQCDKVCNGESIGHCGDIEIRVFLYHWKMEKERLELGLGGGAGNLPRPLSVPGTHPAS